MPPSWRTRASSRCSSSMACWPRSCASWAPAWSASCAFSVKRSSLISESRIPTRGGPPKPRRQIQPSEASESWLEEPLDLLKRPRVVDLAELGPGSGQELDRGLGPAAVDLQPRLGHLRPVVVAAARKHALQRQLFRNVEPENPPDPP